ncbi:MAG: hypothetical protein NVSMB29_08750 [Candidatus Dormibacteria bacterium]
MRALGRLARAGLAPTVGLVVVGCGAAGPSVPSPASTQPVPAAADRARLVAHAGPGGTASLGATSYALDQLAPPPVAQSGAPVLLAVIRASTTGPATHLHAGGISLVDDRGQRWAPVPIPTYVAIDALENAPIEPSRGAAGTVAFRLPAGRLGVAVAVQSHGEEVLLDAAP